MNILKYICPVCGYSDLDSPPFDEFGAPSFNICPCCKVEFGYEDAAQNMSQLISRHKILRSDWISKGMPWWTEYSQPPDNWDPVKQLENLKYVLPSGAAIEQYEYPENPTG